MYSMNSEIDALDMESIVFSLPIIASNFHHSGAEEEPEALSNGFNLSRQYVDVS
jgi:hypothetical protein